MFQNIEQSYTLADASLEIMLIFCATLALGMMLGWMLKTAKSVNEVSQDQGDFIPVSEKIDDLQIIEGIGPAIEKLLKKQGVETYTDIVKLDVSGLEKILEEGGSRFKAHIPTTWPDQARLASKGKWSELEEYQDILNAGK